MKTNIIALFAVFLILIHSSTAYELQNGFYEVGFAGPDCKNSLLAKFEYRPLNTCSLTSNATDGCIASGKYSSFYRSCGSPPRQLLDAKQEIWLVENRTDGPNCTNVVSAVGNRVQNVFRDSPTTGYMWTCSKEGRKHYFYDHCEATTCKNSGGFTISYPNSTGVCTSKGNIYFCEELSYSQVPQSPVATPAIPPINAPVTTPVNSPTTPVSTPENLPSPEAQNPNSNNVTPMSTNSTDRVPTWILTLLIISGVVIVSLIVAIVMLHIRHKRNSYARIQDLEEA
jgi:hypothetical protein